MGEKFWNDQKQAQQTLQDIKKQEVWLGAWKKVQTKVSDLETLYLLGAEEKDEDTLKEAESSLISSTASVEELELKKMLSGEDDAANCLITIHSGAGGTESTDWALMLYRMYSRWLEVKPYKCNTLDFSPGEEAGIKNATIEVNGDFAFGYLKSESGVHRLVRISPFDSNKRRHTSFASVHVIPIVEGNKDFEIDPTDIRIDTYRASGAGGQHVNKTESAVRMTHLPTNIVAQCQNERSQLKNRDACLKILKARVYQQYRDEEAAKRDAKAAEKKKIEWGSQIRNYVLHPYNLIKDVRTSFESSNTQAILDGDLDGFINAYLLNLKQ